MVSIVSVPVVTVSESVAVATLTVAAVVVTVDTTVDVEIKETVEVHGGRGNFEEQKAKACGTLESGNNSL